MSAFPNYYANDADRAAIWEMLMTRDFEAFAAQDWSMVADDFLADEFFGLSGNYDRDITNWKPAFATLDAYRRSWLDQAKQTAQTADMDKLVPALLAASSLKQIDISGDFAVAHKKFDGVFPLSDGTSSAPLLWQTLYLCRKVEAGWKIRGFVGYLPNPLVPNA